MNDQRVETFRLTISEYIDEDGSVGTGFRMEGSTTGANVLGILEIVKYRIMQGVLEKSELSLEEDEDDE